MKIRIWEFALAVSLIITVLYGATVNKEQNRFNEKLIRLHVVANSDTEYDQELKLKVRDAVISELNNVLRDAKTKSDAKKYIMSSSDIIRAAAMQTVSDNGYDYPVSVSLKEENFPTREYDTFSLPAGKYDSLRITIGEGKGQNWWCVVFPPVCAAQTLTMQEAAAVGLTEDEYRLITEADGGYVVKFRFMELLGKIKSLF